MPICLSQVAKGPDSAGVVGMARELGGVTVRGNHEFEVSCASSGFIYIFFPQLLVSQVAPASTTQRGKDQFGQESKLIRDEHRYHHHRRRRRRCRRRYDLVT